jgi:hypothetical protein
MTEPKHDTEGHIIQITRDDDEQEDLDVEADAPVPPRFRRLRRLGCVMLVVIWFTILLLPCFFIVLATQQQIVISQGSLPDQQLRIWLIMETTMRGLGISSTSVHPAKGALLAEDALCLQTNVSYILWQGQGDATSYCDCYTRDAESWLLAASQVGDCPS